MEQKPRKTPRGPDVRHDRVTKRRRPRATLTSTKAPRKVELRSEVMDVTPAMAENWLDGKTPNREVSDRLVERYARDMQAHAWHLNGEPIIFDEDEKLMDGQHRLWAVWTSACTVPMLVVFGAARESMDTYDMGRARKFSDALQIKGHTNTKQMSAAARWWFWYDYNRQGGSLGSPTHHELNEVIRHHPEVGDAARMVQKTKAGRLITPGILTFVLSAALERSPEKAQAFLEALNTGVNLDPSNAVYHLREKMVSNANSTKKLDPIVIAAYTVKVWNYFFKDRQMRHLRWANTHESRPEAFPTFED